MRGRPGLSDRLYTALLHLYPKEFRAACAQQMRQTFRDACRAAYHQHGVTGLAALWLPTLLDLLITAFKERARQGEISMSKARAMSLVGPLTVLAGLMWMLASTGELVNLIEPASADTFWDLFWFYPSFLSLIPLLFALIGARQRFQPSAGVPGRLGLALSIAGCAGMIGTVLASLLLGLLAPESEQFPWFDYLMAACLLGLMLGHFLFGVDALRYRLLPRWNLLPLLLSIAVVFRFAPQWLGLRNYHPLQLGAYFLHLAITGACWVLIGLALMDRGREPQPDAAA